MSMADLTPEEINRQEISSIEDQLLPLRDRIVKIETVIDYHDKEFENVKTSINDLSATMIRQHDQIIKKLEDHNKQFLDVTYSHYREQGKVHQALRDDIKDNKNKFDNYVSRWKAVSWAVWFTISVTLGAIAWGINTAKDLGFFEAVEQSSIQYQKKQEHNL